MTYEHIKALDKLIAAVESGGDAIQHNIYIKAAHAFPPESAYRKCTFHEVAQSFDGSLDASNELHEALLGYDYGIASFNMNGAVSVMRKRPLDVQYGFAYMNPARAWLIAILKAYRAKQEVKPIQNN